jgi:hypothetical protein
MMSRCDVLRTMARAMQSSVVVNRETARCTLGVSEARGDSSRLTLLRSGKTQ